MTSNHWGLLGMLFIVFCLFFYIKKANKYTEEWYGEQSFLKKPRAYEVKFRDLFDLELFYAVYFLFMGLFIINISCQILHKEQLYKVFFVFTLGLFIILGSSYIFYWKSIFFKQNGDKIYYFDPIEKYFSIIKNEEIKINFTDIEDIDFYSTNNKLSISFCILNLKNGKKIALTQELKNYHFLPDFFIDLKQDHHTLSFSLFYKWLAWMKKN